MSFLLDTDTVSYALRGEGRVGIRIREHKPSQLCISAITLAELEFGAARRGSRRLRELIGRFVQDVEVVSFDGPAAGEYGRLAAVLAARGTPIGEFDVLIAAHAITLRRTLVTNNLRHFTRVPGLAVETWA